MTILYGYKKKEKGSEWEKEREKGRGEKKDKYQPVNFFWLLARKSTREKKRSGGGRRDCNTFRKSHVMNKK